MQQLVELGPRAHLVLANGSISIPKGKDGRPKWTTAQARTHDENKAARKRLRDADVDVDADNRFVAPGALAHNKFAVIEESGTPRRVWTGSTNWTTSGLCTQLNNALLVEDEDVASAYRAQWDLLRAAGSAHPASLATSNATLPDHRGRPQRRQRVCPFHPRAEVRRPDCARRPRPGGDAGRSLPRCSSPAPRAFSRTSSSWPRRSRSCSSAASSASCRRVAPTSRRARRRQSR